MLRRCRDGGPVADLLLQSLFDAARQTRPDLKVLFVTGFAENAAVGNGHLDPGMQVITKSFAMLDLANKIAEMI